MTGESESSKNELVPAVSALTLRPGRRFQFSLATLFWLTTLVACFAAVLVTYRRMKQNETALQETRRELGQFRWEMGFFKFFDPNKICLRVIGHGKKNQWAWRFYLPEGHQYRLLTSAGALPEDGYPAPNEGSIRTLSAGEYVLRAFAEPGRNGKWRLGSELFEQGDFAKGRGAVDIEIPPLDQGYETGLIDLCPEIRTIEPAAINEVRLLRCEIDDDADASPSHPQQGSKGFMLWIEKAK